MLASKSGFKAQVRYGTMQYSTAAGLLAVESIQLDCTDIFAICSAENGSCGSLNGFNGNHFVYSTVSG